MAYKILHIGDVHLDTLFAADAAFAKLRRRQLQDAFERALALAREVEGDAVCIAGDLFEREHAGLDRAAYLRRTLGALAPIRVFISPGNHDPYASSSLYRLMEPLPENVTIFRSRRFAPVRIADRLTLWGCAHERERDLEPILSDVECRGEGAHLLLFHGSETSRIPPGKEAVAPFAAADVARSGAAHAMVGHYHGMIDGARFAYTGSLEPLNSSQDGRHTACVVSVEDGHVGLEFKDINATSFAEIDFDVSPFGDRAAVADAVRARVAEMGAPGAVFTRVRLVGLAPPTLSLDAEALREELAGAYPGIDLVDRYAAFDLDAIQHEGQTVRAAFVCAMRERSAAALSESDRSESDQALKFGLLAFARKELSA